MEFEKLIEEMQSSVDLLKKLEDDMNSFDVDARELKDRIVIKLNHTNFLIHKTKRVLAYWDRDPNLALEAFPLFKTPRAFPRDPDLLGAMPAALLISPTVLRVGFRLGRDFHCYELDPTKVRRLLTDLGGLLSVEQQSPFSHERAVVVFSLNEDLRAWLGCPSGQSALKPPAPLTENKRICYVHDPLAKRHGSCPAPLAQKTAQFNP